MYSYDEDNVSLNSEEQQPSASRVADNLPSTDFSYHKITEGELNPLNAELNPICHFLALLGAHHNLHVSKIRVNDFITNLKLPKRRQNIWHQGYNRGIYYTTPPSHINLGLKKNFIKALDVKGPAFTYLHGKLPKLTFEKVKAGVFIGPQIRQLFKDQQFEAVLNDKEKAAWKFFEKFSNGFLGNLKAANFRELLQDLVDSYDQMKCIMLQKMYFSFLQVDFVPLNCGSVSDENGENFHQDILVMEHMYKRK
jgi:hypothetical protein